MSICYYNNVRSQWMQALGFLGLWDASEECVKLVWCELLGLDSGVILDLYYYYLGFAMIVGALDRVWDSLIVIY